MDPQEITARFALIKAPADSPAPQAMDQIRHETEDLAHRINDLVPEGREKSAALTKLEEALFWANRGIARGIARGIHVD